MLDMSPKDLEKVLYFDSYIVVDPGDTPLMKKQIIKAPKSWLHIVALALAVVMIVPYVSVFRIDYGDAEKFQWSDVVLSDVIPEPNPLFGEVVSNADDYLSLYIYKIDQSDYDTYVAACKAQGFTIDADVGDGSYYAYNAAGYKLSLYFYESDGKMHIGVDAAEEYGVLEWSASEIASLLPIPESTTGEIAQDDEKGFSAYVSNTSIDAYKAYVTACVNMGFDVDANDTGKHYSAQNADGYKLSVDHQPLRTATAGVFPTWPEWETPCAEGGLSVQD